ncbi:MAG: MFS transporter [Bacillota bacterium]
MFVTRTARIDHAWHIVAAGFVVSLLTVGTRFATGPFMASIMEAYDLTHTQFSSIVAASLLIYGLLMPVAGRLADLFGGRLVLMAGGIILSLSLVLSALATSATLFALAFAGLASLGFAATSHVALSAVIGRWFVKRRGLAMTFLSSGGMSGIAVMVPLSAALIARIGWRGTLLVFAGVILVAVVLSAISVGAPPADGEQEGGGAAARPNWSAALTTQPFWMLVLTFFACGFSMNILGTHGVPMLEDHGFPTMTAAFGVGLIGLVSVFGSLAIGAASDRVGRRTFLALIYGVRGIGFLGLLFAGREWELYAVAAVGGLVWAGSSAMTSAITADLFGARSVGTLFGLIFLGHQVGAAAGSYLGGWGYDTYGSYLLPFGLTTLILMGAAYLSLRLPGRAVEPQPQLAAGD